MLVIKVEIKCCKELSTICHLLPQVHREKRGPCHQVNDLEGVVVRIEGGNPESFKSSFKEFVQKVMSKSPVNLEEGPGSSLRESSLQSPKSVTLKIVHV